MKFLKIAILMLILVMSVSAVCAADNITDDLSDDSQDVLATAQEDISSAENSKGTFTDLKTNISDSVNIFEMDRNYAFSNETDSDCINGIVINKTNFIIEGNGFAIDANSQSRIFNITGTNITINNLVFRNGNANMGGAIYALGHVTLNNVTFINNSAVMYGGAVLSARGVLDCYGSRFIDNCADNGAAMYLALTELNMHDTCVTSQVQSKFAQIGGESNAVLNFGNVTFSNINSIYSPAMYFESCFATITNSRFVNLSANKTAGAIAIKNGGDTYIINCEFINTSSSKNAGAIYADITGMKGCEGNVTIIGTSFRDAHSAFGGAYMQLGGKLLINDSVFVNDDATLNGGAVYISFVDARIDNCTFDSNSIREYEGYPTYGGAIYSDYCELNLTGSRFIKNSGGAVYALDSIYAVSGTTFEDNVNAVFTAFDRESYLDNATNVYNDDTVLTNITFYDSICVRSSTELELIDNVINVDALPARFDLRDWGWVTSVKNQGNMGACWTFGMLSSLESALLRACGIYANLSENNMQNTMLKYSRCGYTIAHEFGGNTMAVSYLVGWLGTFSEDYDSYDELGKISPLISPGNDIHVQDVMFISMIENNGSYVKAAILQYGAVDGAYYGQATAGAEPNPYFNLNTSAQYVNESIPACHEISIVGWDDNYPKENFLITPPKDGAWIIKNSMGSEWGDQGYVYVSYYDKTLSISTDLGEWITSVIIENTVHYNKNYQYEFSFDGNFLHGENISYANVFDALEDDLIAAVGTYFEGAGMNYTLEIYVNGELKLTQEGVSPYYGYHTIKLDKYIPVNAGDVFSAVITSNAMPFTRLNMTRVHSANKFSYMGEGGNWTDLYDQGMVACLKIYTVADDSVVADNRNISVYYGGQSYFAVKVVTADGHAVGAGADVQFSINGRNVTATTDDEGIAKVKITDVPGTYDITTSYNGENYKNKVTVKLNLNTCKIMGNRNIVVDYLGGKYFSVKVVSADGKVAAAGATVKFTINGRAVVAKTDKYGIAKIKITDAPKKYLIVSTFNGKSVKNTVTVRHIVKTTKVTVKKTAKTFTLKAVLKINGKAQKGKTITFKLNGVKYYAKTNAYGIAQKTFNKNVIAKLVKGKTYVVQVSYLKDIVKSTVRVV